MTGTGRRLRAGTLAGGAISRRALGRRLLAVGIGAAASRLDPVLGPRPARAQGGRGEVVVCTWGGSYVEAQRKFFFDPFERETGIRVRTVGVPDIAKIRAMVQARNVEWDLVDAEGQMMLRLAADDLLERADFTVVPTGDLLPAAVSEWGIGSVAYAYSLGWNSKAFPAGRAPGSWKDFFDTRAFPGRRAMYGQPIPVLEFALLADGVAMDRLYPLDVDRAFRFLEQHKSAVSVWYKSPAQIQTLMRGGEVELIEGFSGRLLDLEKAGADVAWTFAQGAWMQSFWITPKGARNREAAMRLMAHYTRPEAEAEFAELFPYGVPNRLAYGRMSAATLAVLPTAPGNLGKQFQVNAAWWAKNIDAILKRWLAFIG
jgi:putative spermidine/putrescine transport system substrate-binding protein